MRFKMMFFIKKFQQILKPGIFALTIFLGGILFFQFNFSFLDPINSALEKVSFRDIYFSKIQGGEIKSDERVVLIDVGDTLKRANIVKRVKSKPWYDLQMESIWISSAMTGFLYRMLKPLSSSTSMLKLVECQ